MQRPLFDDTSETQSDEYHKLMLRLRRKINKIRVREGLSKLVNHAQFFRFVHNVYKNNWNSLLLDLKNVTLVDTMNQYKLDRFQSLVQRKRKRNDNKRIALNSGYVYIITNPAFPEWVKVGSTINIDERLRSYQTSDPKRGFVVNWSEIFDDRIDIENKLRKLIKNEGIEISNEWCKIHYSKVKYLCKNLCLG